jgi:hypothetical protein
MTRAANIHAARVYLAEARRRRGQSFAFVLLQWAANARHRAMAEPAQREPAQGELFKELP